MSTYTHDALVSAGGAAGAAGGGGNPHDAAVQVWERWIALWNGDLAIGEDLLADAMRVNSPKLSGSIDPSQIRDRAGAMALIAGVRTIADLRFVTEVGPIADGGFVVGGWSFGGTYLGGLPESTAEPGTLVQNRGIDILRVENGRVAEWWSAAENLGLLAALGIIRVG